MLFGFFVVIKRIKNSFFLFFFSSSQTFFPPRSNRRLLGGVHVREYQRFRFVSEGRKRIDI